MSLVTEWIWNRIRLVSGSEHGKHQMQNNMIECKKRSDENSKRYERLSFKGCIKIHDQPSFSHE